MGQYITDFHGEYWFLSNFYFTGEVQFEAWLDANENLMVPLKSVEAYYQGCKTKDKELRLHIWGLPPDQSKKEGRKLALRDDWESIKFNVMNYALALKFKTGTQLAERLLATGTAGLIEGNNWHDNIWGDCRCPKCCNVFGQNALGKLLMERRAELRKDYAGQ